jgi:hypothetical protein
MMVLPKKVKLVAVSIVVRPVTQTAEVEVKNASVMLIPFVVADGSINKRQPISIIKIKLERNRSDGLIPFKKLKLFLENSIKKIMLLIPIR